MNAAPEALATAAYRPERGTLFVDSAQPAGLDTAALISRAQRAHCARVVMYCKGERHSELRLIGRQWHRVDRTLRHRAPRKGFY